MQHSLGSYSEALRYLQSVGARCWHNASSVWAGVAWISGWRRTLDNFSIAINVLSSDIFILNISVSVFILFTEIVFVSHSVIVLLALLDSPYCQGNSLCLYRWCWAVNKFKQHLNRSTWVDSTEWQVTLQIATAVMLEIHCKLPFGHILCRAWVTGELLLLRV